MNPSETEIRAVVAQKFRPHEKILNIFETYQIVGPEHQNRLLVIVYAEESYALFAIALTNYPPTVLSDLCILQSYPVDSKLSVNGTSGGGISPYQIRIAYENEESVFYYYPDEATVKAKDDFCRRMNSIKGSFEPSQVDHGWLDYYRHSDAFDIDRRIADGTAAPKNRESRFKEELDKRRHEYTIYQPFRIFIATWNVNGILPNEICLREWLSVSEEPPDLYAVGFQEIDMSPETIIFNETRPDRAWVAKVMEGLHPGAEYDELISVRMVGIMLTVAIRSKLRPNVTRCVSDMVGTGKLKMGNKGGVAVSIQLNEALICFVNSHLAAHMHEVERRNEDFAEIVRRIQFIDGISRRSIDEHHHIFWLGDLNYRVNTAEVRPQYDYNQFYTLDQLYVEKKAGRVFVDYTEGPITFRPTYKYDTGTDNFDSSEKMRAPAWCDRVLWKGQRIQLLEYDSIMNIRFSDHKPVFAAFLASVQTRDSERFKRVHEEVLKSVDKYENDNQPTITVAQTDIDFEEIRFNETYTRELLVANNCHLPVHFEFRGKNGAGDRPCEEWIEISHENGELFTGDSVSIRLKIFLGTDHIAQMREKVKDAKSGEKVPLDILVLHVDNGRDTFITLFGEYKPSCFGFSMETLVKLSSPIVNYDLTALMDIELNRNQLIDISSRMIPREVWLLIDYLYKHGLSTVELFTLQRRYSKNLNVNEIRDWLDTWSTEPFPGTPHTAAEALLMLFDATPEPLLNISDADIGLHGDYFERCRDLIITKVSSLKRRIFLYLCLFLRELRKSYAVNRMDDRNLALIFTRVLLRTAKRTPYNPQEEDRRRRFIGHFLVNDIQKWAEDELSVMAC